MRFSQSTHLEICLSLETLTPIIQTGLTILVELIGLVNSAIIFLSQMTLLSWLTFLLGFLTLILTVLLFCISFFLLMLVFVFFNVFPYIGNFWSSCCLSFHWPSIIFTKWCPVSLYRFRLFSCWLEWSSWSFGTYSMGAHLKNQCFCCAASEFCEWLQVGIDACIPHYKYQVKPHSSPWFSAACAAARNRNL